MIFAEFFDNTIYVNINQSTAKLRSFRNYYKNEIAEIDAELERRKQMVAAKLRELGIKGNHQEIKSQLTKLYNDEVKKGSVADKKLLIMLRDLMDSFELITGIPQEEVEINNLL